MGDRYISDVKCPYCTKTIQRVMFADDWGETAHCHNCGKWSALKLEQK